MKSMPCLALFARLLASSNSKSTSALDQLIRYKKYTKTIPIPKDGAAGEGSIDLPTPLEDLRKREDVAGSNHLSRTRAGGVRLFKVAHRAIQHYIEFFRPTTVPASPRTPPHPSGTSYRNETCACPAAIRDRVGIATDRGLVQVDGCGSAGAFVIAILHFFY